MTIKLNHLFGLVALVALGALGCAQAPNQPEGPSGAYQPSEGQRGENVSWVPTPPALVDKMLDMAGATPRDYLIDLGSGDGRLVITAAKRGIKALGIEYNPDLVELSNRNAREAGVAASASFVKADLFQADLSKATVITLFLLEDLNRQLRPRLLDLKPGTRIVSNTFTMGDWEADETATLYRKEGCGTRWCTAHLWIIPAKVAGTYRLPQGELTLRQEFQMLNGTLTAATGALAVEGKVRGDKVTIVAGGREYRGRMNGARLELDQTPAR